jgi:hypothetical protein
MAFYYDNRYGDIIYSDGCPIDPWSYVMQPGDQVYMGDWPIMWPY